MDRKKKLSLCSYLLQLHECEEENEGCESSKRTNEWVKPWIREFSSDGHYEKVYNFWKNADPERFKRTLRLTPDQFNWLLAKIQHRIQKQDTRLRKAIPAHKRLAITLKYLATGIPFYHLASEFVVGDCTVGRIVSETCAAIIAELTDYCKVPSTENEWKAVAEEYYKKWDYPNTIGALDGKHVVIEKPNNSGSHFFNYKGHFSVVLFALADANGRFIFADVGTNGAASDAQIWQSCPLQAKMLDNSLKIPPPAPLPNSDKILPYHIIGDDIFPLTTFLMKPYPRQKSGPTIITPHRIFDYRLSRARRIVENAFGMLVHRFQVFRTPIRVESVPEITRIVMACCILHNWLLTSDLAHENEIENVDIELGGSSDQTSPENLRQVTRQGSNNSSNDARNMRDTLRDYFCQEGTREWQADAIRQRETGRSRRK